METEPTQVTKKIKKTGTREEVWNGLAGKTKGGLTKDCLLLDGGKLKSKKAVERCKGLHTLKQTVEKADEEVKSICAVEEPAEVSEVKKTRGRPRKAV